MSSGRRRRNSAAGAIETAQMRTPTPRAAVRQPDVVMRSCTKSGMRDAPMGKPRLPSEKARPRRTMNQLGMMTAVATAMTPVFMLRAIIWMT